MDINLNYDFDYQQVNIIPPRVVLPSDRLTLECYYDNVHNETIVGGESTQEEMCFGFIYYYPRLPLSGCFSTASRTAYETFIGHHNPSTQLEIISNISRFGLDLRKFVDNYPWNQRQYKAFQDSLMNHQNHFCRTPSVDETDASINLEDLEGDGIFLHANALVMTLCAVFAVLSQRTA